VGWWKIEGTANVIGDEPLDVLSGAVAGVVAKYQTAFGRCPTKDVKFPITRVAKTTWPDLNRTICSCCVARCSRRNETIRPLFDSPGHDAFVGRRATA
jgi:hypothetical protein